VWLNRHGKVKRVRWLFFSDKLELKTATKQDQYSKLTWFERGHWFNKSRFVIRVKDEQSGLFADVALRQWLGSSYNTP
jgi:hypothetical protein